MLRDELIGAARRAIVQFGPDSEAFPCIGLYASHHREELDAKYWADQLGVGSPPSDTILELLVPVDADEDESEDDQGEYMIDFTLPGDVTQYVLCVRIDHSGQVVDITMES